MTKVFMILLLLMNCASTPSTTILDASGISDKVRNEVTGASVPKLSALGWTTATLY